MAYAWLDKVVTVTGAGTGVGRALCLELAARGAIVYATARALEKCQPVADEIRSRGGRAFAEVLDVAEPEGASRLVDRLLAEHGALDVWVNNAGVMFVGEYYEMDEASIDTVVGTNLLGPMRATLHAYRAMREQGAGKIVNVSSMGGFLPNASMSAYAATKFGLSGFTWSVAAEAKAFGVELQVAYLGLVESEMLRKAEALNPGAESIYEVLPMKPQPVGEAARRIADGVARGDRMIFTPRYARIMWTLQRLLPRTLAMGAPLAMKRYRDLRDR